jgi:branched-chain amino acid transport system substrate-binding protein
MALDRRSLLGAAAALPALGGLPFRSARAQAANTIKIGVLNDGSGMYRDIAGETAAVCARQAVADFGNQGFNVEVLHADHQNKPDVGSNIARQWIDQNGVDVLLDVTTSSVALAVNDICREKNKVHINSGAATSDLTGAKCSPNTVHWTYDTWMLAHSTGAAMVKAGGDSWYFITADYAFGHALERDTGNFVKQAGGQVLGAVRSPFPGTTDFSSFLVQAQASRAKVIGFANAGTDTINCIKQAAEFGITRRGTKLAALLMFLTDVHSLGLATANGLVCTETFYWDMNEATRRFTAKVRPNMGAIYPTMTQAGCYAGTLHYLKAVKAMGVANAKASGREVVAQMKRMPTDDDAFGKGLIREDGRKIHPSFLLQVKRPGEYTYPGDVYTLAGKVPAEQAFRPLSEGGCALVKA